MRRYGIIAVGYNRLESLKRLLTALNQIDDQGYTILLIISLDFAGMPEIVEMAEKFHWIHGKKEVKLYQEKQGLRKHILQCGDYLEEYSLDAVAVFEDDIVPSPAFFNYMRQAVEYYEDNMQIAGISLYTHLWNVNCERPFVPLISRFDVFFLQFAQSWGQIWMKKQWTDFKLWYQQNSESFFQAEGVPTHVCQWKDSSWLKYHIRYCIERNKYFVYPYEALCTNFTEIGEHNEYSTAFFQVPLQMDEKKQYLFVGLSEAPVIYDSFFENEKIAQNLQISKQELCIDIYGSKVAHEGKRYWLTTKEVGYQILRTYGLKVKPQELNIMLEINGTEIKLYDTETEQKNLKEKYLFYRCYDYYFKLSHCAWKDLLKWLKEKIRDRFV